MPRSRPSPVHEHPYCHTPSLVASPHYKSIYIYLYIFFPSLFFNVFVGQLFCNVLGELLLSIYVKCHVHVGCVTVLKYDMPYILQVNKYAFSGGQDSMENHRKFGANLEVAVQFSLR